MDGGKKLDEIVIPRRSNEHKKDLNSRCEDLEHTLHAVRRIIIARE